MAKLTPEKKAKIFEQLNERKLPWRNARFLIKDGDYGFLGAGNFSEVYVMEDVDHSETQYAVKIIGFSEHRTIHKSDFASYKKEPTIQNGVSEKCGTVVRVFDTEVLSIQLDTEGNIVDACLDDSGVEKNGWLALIMIRMEKLSQIIETNFTNDHSLTVPKLQQSDDKEIMTWL